MFRLICILSAGMFFMQSCTESCSCHKQCEYFNKDSIEVCSDRYTSYNAYGAVCDSMQRLYGGPVHDTTTDNYDFKAVQNQASWNKVAMLEAEGYRCICAR